jgi:ribonuclease HI
LSEDKVIIFTDGGAKPNPGVGGWAALLIWGEYQKEISGGEKNTSNNRMELTAAIQALEALSRPVSVEFYTDSEYLKNGITSWIRGWQRNGWKTAKGDPVLNQDLWMKLHDLTQKHKIDWRWTRGHAGDANNERVDKLATEARMKVMRGS